MKGAITREPLAKYKSYFKIENNKQATIQRSHIEEIIQLDSLTEGARYSDNYNGYRISFVLGEYYEFQIEKILTVDNSLLLVHSETGYCELLNN